MAGYLLDTNVISEMMRQQPEPKVLEWVAKAGPGKLHLCAPVYGEIKTGILRLPAGKRKSKLALDFENLVLALFGESVLTFDHGAAEIWAVLMAEGASQGRVRPEIDMQIAAIALRDRLTVVTRDTFHFEAVKVSVLRPWPDGSTA